MTTLQIIVMSCAYAVVLAAVIYFTRATSRRVAGALAGGAAAGCWGLGAIIVGEEIGLWRDFLPSAHSLWVLFYFGLAIPLSPIYLITWRAARRFGWRGLGMCLIVAGVVGPPRDYLYAGDVPGVGRVRAGRGSSPGRCRDVCRPRGIGACGDAARQRSRARKPVGAPAFGRLTGHGRTHDHRERFLDAAARLRAPAARFLAVRRIRRDRVHRDGQALTEEID